MLDINNEKWDICGRKENCTFDGGVIRARDASAVLKDTDIENFELVFSARSPENETRTELWASFRRYSRDYHYMVGLRGDGHNHLYLSRLGAEGYDMMLALCPLDITLMPGTWYRIRIICSGTKTAVYLGDETSPRILCDDADAPFRSGSVAFGGGYAWAEYRDISLSPCGSDALDGVTAMPDYLSGVTLSDEEKKAARRRARALYRAFPVPLLPDGRSELSLEGEWLFIPEKEAGEDPSALLYDDSGAHTMHVPESWVPLQAWLEGETFANNGMNKGQSDSYWLEAYGRCMNYTFDWQDTQCAWYRHYIDLPAGIETKDVILDFEGIALESEIYVNGIKLRHNIGMFAPMSIDASGCVRAGRNVIAVKVRRTVSDAEIQGCGDDIDEHYVKARNPEDEKFYAHDCEHRPFNTDDIAHGFYRDHPGGIWRSVKLIIRDRLHTDSCWFRPRTDGAEITLTVGNTGTEAGKGTLSYSLVHKVTGEYLCGGDIQELELAPGESREITFRTPEVSPRLWEPGKPNLYRLSAVISDQDGVRDIYKEEVGFRTVSVSGSRILFNGRPLWIRGGNHMPAHVKPNDRRLADRFIEISLENNVIATRTHAAPWTDVWHRSADEHGMLVSLEGTWPWMMGGPIPSDRALELWQTELKALFMRHRNSPSLFLITMNNEMNFYLSRGSDETVREKGYRIQSGIRMAREVFPDLPLVCDSGYNRAPVLEKSRDLNFPYANGRYERIIQKYGFDDGDVDDPHFYYGWYDKDFFHFMNGDFGWRETIPGRPCILQECSVGYCRDEDGLACRYYMYAHQTPQTTTGRRSYEHNDPAYYQRNHAFQVKGLAEMFRRVEHERVSGILLFAFETWFYHHCDPLRVQTMRSARELRTAYQPVLVCAELYSRHFMAGKEICVPVTVINDDRGRDVLEAPEVTVTVETDEGVLATERAVFDDTPYYGMSTRTLSVRLPDRIPGGAKDAVLRLRAVSGGKTVSENGYEIFTAEESWANPEKKDVSAVCLADDGDALAFLNAHHIHAETHDAVPSGNVNGKRLVIAKIPDAELSEKIYGFACAGGKVIMLGQRDLDPALTGGKEIPFTEDATEYVTMNAPENSIFRGIGENGISLFDNGKSVPYAAYGRYSPDRFDRSVTALGETLQWHSYMGRPTDYSRFGGTPLFAVRCGSGCILISSVRTDADGRDPVARKLTDNILTWDFVTD